jgi:anaerobic dimethyl sulfoxide reductase subunit B (iron-sulfur subunit)
MAQQGFFFDMNICSGCKCCFVACKETKDLGVGFNFRKVTDYEGGKFPAVWTASLSMGCNHCATPACMAVCPVSAIVKNEENGLVNIDKALCINCKTCITACPYGAPVELTAENTVSKCDGCASFLALGEKPACVAACSTRALDFGDIAELETKYANKSPVKDISVIPDSVMTQPNYLIAPKPQIV